VVFFLPWLEWLREDGCEVLCTARDLSQTHDLLRLHGVPFHAVGGHRGGGTAARVTQVFQRAAGLTSWARGKGIDLALGHGSRAQVLAASWMRIPSLTFFDYEYVSARLFGLFCSRILVPEACSVEALRARGVPEGKLLRYPGFKEQVYLDPDRDRPEPSNPPIVLLRPPARKAHYHTERSERSYVRLLDRLTRGSGYRIRILPRYASDTEELAARVNAHDHMEIVTQPEDAKTLLRSAALVASGGGTMVREAAVLGIPAASFFGGPLGGVDRALAEAGRLTLLRTDEEVDALPLPPRPNPAAAPLPDANTLHEFLRGKVRRAMTV